MTEKPITFDRVVRWVGTGLLIIGIILLLNRLSHVLLPFFVAWFFAYLLYPMVKFVERIKTVHAAAMGDGQTAEAHSVEMPYASREALLERLRNDALPGREAIQFWRSRSA